LAALLPIGRPADVASGASRSMVPSFPLDKATRQPTLLAGFQLPIAMQKQERLKPI
jgi:hypothetical protein